MTAVDGDTSAATGTRGHAELIRALGAIAIAPDRSSDAVCEALGLPTISAADHTAAFVLQAPPHAAIHLGTEGKLGGEGADRVEGFWRALGMSPPRSADHLGVLLLGYAYLLDSGATSPAAMRAAGVLFHEHIWPFAPGYLRLVAGLRIASVHPWASLMLRTLQAEVASLPAPDDLPLALRTAPDALHGEMSLNDLLDALVAPVRCGVPLSHRDLEAGTRALGIGYRRGERRYALKAMMEQDKPRTLEWFAELARTWVVRHAEIDDPTPVGRWWGGRAASSATVLDDLAGEAR